MEKCACFIACLTILAACSGDGQSIDTQSKQQLLVEKAMSANYQDAVQELYIAYFGRPADPGGLANFEAALANDNAPTDIAGLNAAYTSNATVRTLIDSFSTSAESIALYGSGSTINFVTVIFQNVLGRIPDSSGLSFWANAIDSGSLSRGDAALSIAAGALANKSMQGLLDAKLIANRRTVAENFTSQLTSLNAGSAYKGSVASSGARAMLAMVIVQTLATAYQPKVNAMIADLQLASAIPPINVSSVPSSPGQSQLIFSGYTFNVRSGGGGPGPNNWSTQNAWVDANGYLHLKISYSNGQWNAVEVYTNQSFGFGSYQFKVIGHPEVMDQNVVLGLFPYTTPAIGPDGTNEIDIEFATWGGAQTEHGNWTVWPANTSGVNTSHQFDMSANTGMSTHRFSWSSQQIYFQALTGLTDNNTGQYANWTFAPSDNVNLIPQNAIPLHMNLWLFQGQPPRDGAEEELVIAEFKWIAG